MKHLTVAVRIAALMSLIVVGLAARSLTSVTPASAGISSSLAIDADTSDGCGVIQSTANITQGAATFLGVCIVDAAAAPVSGLISGATLRVTYTAPLTASNVAGNGTTDLDSNPDWSQAMIGGSWDCNSLDLPASAPTATPSPAFISCDSVALADVPVSGNVLLATLNFDAAGSLGTSTLAFGVTDLSTGALGVNNPVCGAAGFTCTGASITVQAAPTATATATATATNTPCANGTPCPTATPTTAATNVPRTNVPRTNTSTVTKTAIATATGTPVAAKTATRPAGVAPTQPSGGAGAGGTVRLPNTGSQPSGGSGTHAWLWLTMSALAAAGIGGAMALTARRHRR